MEQRLGVKNLGPIREAEIDLSKRLIVLTGPNDSGKTWLTWCVYGFLKLPARRLLEAMRPFAQELLQHPQHQLSAERTKECWRRCLRPIPQP